MIQRLATLLYRNWSTGWVLCDTETDPQGGYSLNRKLIHRVGTVRYGNWSTGWVLCDTETDPQGGYSLSRILIQCVGTLLFQNWFTELSLFDTKTSTGWFFFQKETFPGGKVGGRGWDGALVDLSKLIHFKFIDLNNVSPRLRPFFCFISEENPVFYRIEKISCFKSIVRFVVWLHTCEMIYFYPFRGVHVSLSYVGRNLWIFSIAERQT